MSYRTIHKQVSFAAILAIIGTVFSASALAAQDRLQTTNVNSVSVGSSPAAYVTNVAGASGNRTINITNSILGSQEVSISVTWGISADSSPPNTSYPKNDVGFSAVTSQGTSVVSLTVAPTTCNFADSTGTCNTTISFTTPNVTEDPIEVTINPTNTGTGSSQLHTAHLKILFSAVAQQAKLDTKLRMPNPQCFTFGAGEVDLEATLKELVTKGPISGRTVYFELDEWAIGSAITGFDGKAVLSLDVDYLVGGDYDLYAEFLGDVDYNPSNAAATLGISYTFMGFQPPINPQGTSIFGNGRVIPIKVKLIDASLQPVGSAMPTVHLYQYSEDTLLGDELEQPTSVSTADTDNIMRYVPADGHYIYNWDLSSLGNGTYVVVVDLGDSAACGNGPYHAIITVEKRGGGKK